MRIVANVGSRNLMIGMDDQAFPGDVEVVHNWYDGDKKESCDVVVGVGYDRSRTNDFWNLPTLAFGTDLSILETVPIERLHTST